MPLLPKKTSHSPHKQRVHHDNLLRREAQVGGGVFGPVPDGHSREFFCLDEHTWIWSESWTNAETKLSENLFVRYEFSSHGVLKIVNGVAKGYVTGKELKNLLRAMRHYSERVQSEVYGRPQTSVA